MIQKIRTLVESTTFSLSINFVILVNAVLIGVETFYTSSLISTFQSIALGIFTIEIVLRFLGDKSAKSYFSNGWNLFDLFIVGICFVPESLLFNSAALSVFRVMRIFRILRLVKTLDELRVIVDVLLRSIKSLFYTIMLLGIFMYMYAVMGVILFKGGPAAANGTVIGPQSPDPYGTISEAFFTLFRIMTGEDWTDLRYNLLGGQIGGISDTMITIYHVSWIGLAAFLLVNLVVGAVVNNYDQVMQDIRTDNGEEVALEKSNDKDEEVQELHSKIDSLTLQLERLTAALEEPKEKAAG